MRSQKPIIKTSTVLHYLWTYSRKTSKAKWKTFKSKHKFHLKWSQQVLIFSNLQINYSKDVSKDMSVHKLGMRHFINRLIAKYFLWRTCNRSCSLLELWTRTVHYNLGQPCAEVVECVSFFISPVYKCSQGSHIRYFTSPAAWERWRICLHCCPEVQSNKGVIRIFHKAQTAKGSLWQDWAGSFEIL